MNKNRLDEKKSPQERIDIIEKKYARVREHPPMEILYNAAMEYLTEKGQKNNGS